MLLRRRNYLTKKNYQAKFVLPFLISAFLANIVSAAVFLILARDKINHILYSMRMPSKSGGELLSAATIMAGIVAITLVSILFLFVSHKMHRKLSLSLDKARAHLQNIARGNLADHIAVTPDDAFRDFSGQLNSMVTRLNSRFKMINACTDELAREAHELKALPQETNASDAVKALRRSIYSLDEQLRFKA
ncbi:MAG TPA: hypothetical protein VEI57_13440 [Nitrospirota bacterium]|nr:hypothetical protein [Nitrospirota bacterium]